MSKRSKSREIVIQALFQYDNGCQDLGEILNFNWMQIKKKIPEDVFSFARELLIGVVDRMDLIDEYISLHLRESNLSGLFSIDRCILRLSIYTFLYRKDIPYAVIINEAVNLAHRFGKDSSYKLVNGVLDSFYSYLASGLSISARG